MKLQWDGPQLIEKRKQAVGAFRAAMADQMLDHQEWVQMTEMLWQLMSDKLHDAQMDVLRSDRFSMSKLMAKNANDRVERFTKYQRTLRALNFLFKCYEIDWRMFLQTVVELVEGKIDVKGLDRPTGRDQQHDQEAATGKGPDDPGSG